MEESQVYKSARLLLSALCLTGFSALAATGAAHAQTPPIAPVPQLPSGVCGTVTSYTAATATAAGTLVLATTPPGTTSSQTYAIAPGATITGDASLTANASVCFIPAATNSSSQITGGTVLPPTATTIVVCGLTAGYTAGSVLSVGGTTFTLQSNATFSGGTPTIGQTQQFTLTVSPLGRVTAAAVAVGQCPATTVTGPITNIVPSTQTTAGSYTIGAATYFVAAGATVVFSQPLAAHPVLNRIPRIYREWMASGGTFDTPY